MEKENIKLDAKEENNLKDRQSICMYFQLLQDTISRMANNSANVKALIAVVYTIFATALVEAEKIQKYWWIGFFISALGLLLDVYYLSFEKIYRKKYEKILDKINNNMIEEKEIFDMKPKNTDLKYEVFAVMLEAVKSFSVIGFYVLFVGITILLKFI